MESRPGNFIFGRDTSTNGIPFMHKNHSGAYSYPSFEVSDTNIPGYRMRLFKTVYR